MPCAAFPLGPMTRGNQELRALWNLIKSMIHAYSMSEHPGTPPAPISLLETAGLAACGETGMIGSLSGPVVAIRSGQRNRSVKPVSGVKATGQALSNSEPIRSGRPPCTGDIDWCRPSTTPASGWPGRMSIPGRPNGYGPTVPIRPRRAREICFFLGDIMGGRSSSGNP